jgi:FkbM family methyltransferase
MSIVEALPPCRLVNTRYGPMLANPNDFYVGQALIRYGEYGEREANFLIQLVNRPGVVVEVGANIGSHTVPLARQAAQVGAELVVFEPQPVVFQNLCANLALNGLHNVRAWPWACGAQAETVFFPRQDYRQQGNFGGVSMQTGEAADHIAVPCMRLDDVIGEQDVSLLKIDVEGFELAVLQGASRILQRFRPQVYLENDRVERSRGLIEWLWAQSYRLWWHVTPLYNPQNHLGNLDNVYGNLASFNMLALPRESGMVVEGLAEITDAGFHPLRPRINRPT